MWAGACPATISQTWGCLTSFAASWTSVPSEAFPGQQNSIIFSLRTGVDGCPSSLARKSCFRWVFILLPSLFVRLGYSITINKARAGVSICPLAFVLFLLVTRLCAKSTERDNSWQVLCSYCCFSLGCGSSAFDSCWSAPIAWWAESLEKATSMHTAAYEPLQGLSCMCSTVFSQCFQFPDP